MRVKNKMLYDRYIGRLVQVELNQLAQKGDVYLGRIKETDGDFILLNPFVLVHTGYYDAEENAKEEVKGIEASEKIKQRREKEGKLEILLNKEVIANITPIGE